MTSGSYPYIWLNGALTSADKALIPVSDRGFRFGDGAFETVRVIEGVPYHLNRHLERLKAGLLAVKIAFDVVHLIEACSQTISRNSLQDGLLRIAVSRGSGSRGYLPEGPLMPTVAIECMDPPPLKRSLTLYLSSWEKPSIKALPVNFKLAQGVNSMLARMEAHAQGADEALLLDAKGNISEASAANIFFEKDGKLYTPASITGCLLGITREVLLEREKVTEGEFSLEDLKRANGVVLTNSASGVTAVSKLVPHGYSWNSESLAKRLSDSLESDRKAAIHRSV